GNLNANARQVERRAVGRQQAQCVGQLCLGFPCLAFPQAPISLRGQAQGERLIGPRRAPTEFRFEGLKLSQSNLRVTGPDRADGGSNAVLVAWDEYPRVYLAA